MLEWAASDVLDMGWIVLRAVEDAWGVEEDDGSPVAADVFAEELFPFRCQIIDVREDDGLVRLEVDVREVCEVCGSEVGVCLRQVTASEKVVGDVRFFGDEVFAFGVVDEQDISLGARG